MAIILSVFVAAVVLVLTLPFIAIATDGPRVASIFSADEEFIANGLERMVNRPSLHYGFFWYPPLYMFLSLFCRGFLTLGGVAGEQASVLGPRLISLLGYVAAVLGAGALTWRLTKQWAPTILAAVWLLSIDDIYNYAMLAHPDTLQLACIAWGLYFVVGYVEFGERRGIVIASALAGAAFVSKFAGTFLIPIIFLSLLVVHRRATLSLKDYVRIIWRDSVATGAAFLLSTLVLAPTFWMNLGAFIKNIDMHNRSVGFGYFERETRGGITWLHYLERFVCFDTYLTWWVFGAGGLAVVVWIAAFTKPTTSYRTPKKDGFMLITVYFLLYFAFLYVQSRMFEVRYLYPIIPAVVALGVGVFWLVRWPTPFSYFILAAVTAWHLWLLPPRLTRLADVALEREARRSHPCFAVGAYLRKHYDPTTPILYDHYTYVPDEFTRVDDSWALSQKQIDRFEPRVILITQRIRERFARNIDPQTWRRGAQQFINAKKTYTELESHQLPYRPVQRFPDCWGTTIYEKE